MTSSKMSLATRLQDELGDSLVMETRFQESIIKARFSVSNCFVPAAVALCNPDLSEGASFLSNPIHQQSCEMDESHNLTNMIIA